MINLFSCACVRAREYYKFVSCWRFSDFCLEAVVFETRAACGPRQSGQGTRNYAVLTAAHLCYLM